MGITATINVALNGFEASVTSKDEAKALILANVAEAFKAIAESVSVKTLERCGEQYGIGFEVHDGHIGNVVFN